jgi:eukaryotic-like serine/threonine-protein kinase
VESPQTLVQASRGKRDEPADLSPRRRIARVGGEARAGADGLVLGRYRLLEQLGSGGFGVVWRAHDELLCREVAVKRVPLGAREGPIDSERATREALAAARLAHPAIVALYEACAEEGAFYLISELVDGDTLARLIAADELEDEEVLEIGIALASALEHAHARGVIHRDIKPQNVLVPHPREDGAAAPQAFAAAAKLTDFGGASLVGEDALTRTGDVLGTLAYMAPEQSEGREVTQQADLYSLALVIYEALSGENPVRGATPAATVRRIGRALPPLARSRRDLPSELMRAIDTALAVAPEDRGTLERLRLALEHALEQGLTQSRWRRAASRAQSPPSARPAGHVARPNAPVAGMHPRARSAAEPRRPSTREHATAERALDDQPAPVPRRGLRLPRGVWLAAGAIIACWQAFAGRPGVALLALVALAPVALLPGEGEDARVGAGWLVCALAPVLGVVGLAGAFPAIAGQASRWRERATLGALGYWWLTLAGPLADPGRSAGREPWLRPPAATPARAVWEGSLGSAAAHAVAPALTLGVLLGALLWAVGAALLPWIVRGRNAVRDAVAVTMWSAALAAAAPELATGLSAHASHPTPRGAVLGALVGAVLAVVTRALRGPV